MFFLDERKQRFCSCAVFLLCASLHLNQPLKSVIAAWISANFRSLYLKKMVLCTMRNNWLFHTSTTSTVSVSCLFVNQLSRMACESWRIITGSSDSVTAATQLLTSEVRLSCSQLTSMLRFLNLVSCCQAAFYLIRIPTKNKQRKNNSSITLIQISFVV